METFANIQFRGNSVDRINELHYIDPIPKDSRHETERELTLLDDLVGDLILCELLILKIAFAFVFVCEG
jgi:hypothetical protein